MMNSIDGKDLAPENFASSASQWDVAGYGRWLRAGLDAWFHPRTTLGGRAVAFQPLILNPDRDPVAPLIDAAEAVPAGLERLRDAGSEALATWTGNSGNAGGVLDALLRMAQRLPAASHVPGLRRLLFEGHLDAEPDRKLLALRALEAAAELTALNEGEALLQELRSSDRWQSNFAATWLEGMARARRIDWLEGMLELRKDLELIDPTGTELQPVFRRLARRAGRADQVRDRLQMLDLDAWLQNALFGGQRPALSLIWTRDDFKKLPIPAIAIGDEIALLYDEPRERERNRKFYAIMEDASIEITSRGRGQPPFRSSRHGRPGRTAEQLGNMLEADDFFVSRSHH